MDRAPVSLPAMDESSLQERFAPLSICFGCGPANPKGLHIRSFVQGDEVLATWRPEPHHEAFPGVLNGGIIGSLLDCHCNWTAAWHLMQRQQLAHPPCTVTADYAIRLLRPTPTDGPVALSARVVESTADRATIEGVLTAGGKPRATCRGTFVAVQPGHPAYHRW
jgi:acyl-coenzyme A thioesterase PaaI-like protein